MKDVSRSLDQLPARRRNEPRTLPVEILNAVDALARQLGGSRSVIATIALAEYLRVHGYPGLTEDWPLVRRNGKLRSEEVRDTPDPSQRRSCEETE